MKKLVLAFLMMSAGTALAQPAAEQPADDQPQPTEKAGSAMPDHGFAPPSDEVPPAPEKEGAGGSAGNPVDPNSQHDMNTGVGTADMHSKDAHGEEHAEHAEEEDPTKNFNWTNFGYHGKDEKGGAFGDGQEDGHPVEEEEPMPAPYVAAVFNFLILFGLILWKGRPAAREMAASRHDQIKTALEEAAILRKAAADKLAEFEERLKKSDDEIKSMVDAIRASAESDKARILENAERSAAQMKKDAETRIAAEIQNARAMLTREVTAAAATATEKLLREKLMPADQQKLVATFITDMSAVTAPQEKR
ncbi:MAG TPA: ATP synthase F0 subunit B [Kofleriaceae bacterium]|jgi:F-type H+-transporting ATPase subunit b